MTHLEKQLGKSQNKREVSVENGSTRARFLASQLTHRLVGGTEANGDTPAICWHCFGFRLARPSLLLSFSLLGEQGEGWGEREGERESRAGLEPTNGETTS